MLVGVTSEGEAENVSARRTDARTIAEAKPESFMTVTVIAGGSGWDGVSFHVTDRLSTGPGSASGTSMALVASFDGSDGLP